MVALSFKKIKMHNNPISEVYNLTREWWEELIWCKSRFLQYGYEDMCTKSVRQR